MSNPEKQPIETANGCWVDLYSSSYFRGRLKRIQGPARIHVNGAGSLIVGPEASVMHAGRNCKISLHPKQIIPDLDDGNWKGKLRSLQVLQVTGRG